MGSRRRADRAAERSRSARPRALSALYAPDRLSLAVRRAERLAGAVRGSPGRGARPRSGVAPPAARGAATPGSGRRLSRGRRAGAAGAGYDPLPQQPARSPEADALVGNWQVTIEQLAATGGRPTPSASCVAPKSHPWSTMSRSIWRAAPSRVAIWRWRCAPGIDVCAPRRRRSGGVLPELHWTAGLAAGRAGRIPLAGSHFAALANAAPTGSCPPSGPARRSGQRAHTWWACIPAWSATICALRRAGVTSTGSWPAPR